MIITLDPELEAALKGLAGRQGVAPEVLALDALRARFLATTPASQPQDEWERRLRGLAKNCRRISSRFRCQQRTAIRLVAQIAVLQSVARVKSWPGLTVRKPRLPDGDPGAQPGLPYRQPRPRPVYQNCSDSRALISLIQRAVRSAAARRQTTKRSRITHILRSMAVAPEGT